MARMTGRCLCGSIQYEEEAEPILMRASGPCTEALISVPSRRFGIYLPMEPVGQTSWEASPVSPLALRSPSRQKLATV